MERLVPFKAKISLVTISIDDSDSRVSFSGPSLGPKLPDGYNKISKPLWVTPMVTASVIFVAFSKTEKTRV